MSLIGTRTISGLATDAQTSLRFRYVGGATNGPASDVRIVGPDAPGEFAAGDWTAVGLSSDGEQAQVVIWAAPAVGAAPTDYEYRVNGGSAISAGSATLPVNVLVSGLPYEAAATIEVRAVNGAVAGSWSAAKSVTPIDSGAVTTIDLSGASAVNRVPAGDSSYPLANTDWSGEAATLRISRTGTGGFPAGYVEMTGLPENTTFTVAIEVIGWENLNESDEIRIAAGSVYNNNYWSGWTDADYAYSGAFPSMPENLTCTFSTGAGDTAAAVGAQIRNAEFGDVIELRLTVSYEDAGVTLVSPPTLVAPVAGTVALSHDPVEDVAVSAMLSTWSLGEPAGALEYRWKIDSAIIDGATGATYTPVTGDVGGTLVAEARVVRGADSTAWVASPSRTVSAAASIPADADYVLASNEWLELDERTLTPGGGSVTVLMGQTPVSWAAGPVAQYTHSSGWQVATRSDFGNLMFHPNGAFDHLDPGEFSEIDLTWRKTGDATDRTMKIVVTGPENLGPDLCRSVSLTGSGTTRTLTLLSPVPDGAVLDVQYRLTGAGSVTAALGGATGRTVSGAGPASDSLRASGAQTTLTFTADAEATFANLTDVRARVVAETGSAAAITYLRASKPTSTTLDLDFGVALADTLPAFPAANPFPAITDPDVYVDLDGVSQTGSGNPRFQLAYNLTNANKLTVRLRNSTFTDYSSLLASVGYNYVILENVQIFGDDWVSSESTELKDRAINSAKVGRHVGCWRKQSLPSADQAGFRIGSGSLIVANGLRIHTRMGDYYDSVNWAPPTGMTYTSLWNVDYSTRWDTAKRNILVNAFGEETTDSLVEGKSSVVATFSTARRMRRALRSWSGTVVAANFTAGDDPSQISGHQLQIWEGGGAMVLWRYAYDGVMARFRGDGHATQTRDSDAHNARFMFVHQRPRLPDYARVNATDFEVEVSTDGGSNWSALDVDMGPNDAIGALYRKGVTVASGVNRVRVRSRWGSKASTWSEAAV